MRIPSSRSSTRAWQRQRLTTTTQRSPFTRVQLQCFARMIFFLLILDVGSSERRLSPKQSELQQVFTNGVVVPLGLLTVDKQMRIHDEVNSQHVVAVCNRIEIANEC